MKVIRLAVLAMACGFLLGQAPPQSRGNSYDDLIRLFREWREFQKPQVVNGVPDYSPAAIAKQRDGLKALQQRLARLDIRAWTVPQKIDYNLVRAEFNGLDFDHRVLRPWSRDPSFYAAINAGESDVPLREGQQIPSSDSFLCQTESDTFIANCWVSWPFRSSGKQV